MASYTNLASLAGLQVGDTVTYNQNSTGSNWTVTGQTIDFAGYSVKIKLYGGSNRKNWNTSSGIGGGAIFNFNSPKNTTFYFSTDGGTCLCYGSSYNAYYRIAVAGDCGSCSDNSTGPNGGGLIPNPQSTTNTTSLRRATSGTQTSGGIGVGGSDGGFGSYGSGTTSSYKARGGNGWYGGGGASVSSASYSAISGAGSGFILGMSNTSYPSGYMGDQTSLINDISSRISSASLSSGSAGYPSSNTHQNGYMIIEILALPTADFPQYYSSGWHDTEWKVYDNGSWHDVEVKYYDGSSWQ